MSRISAVIPRELTWATQQALTLQTAPYVRADGTLDIPKLLESFQQYFRENSDSWIASEQYREAGAQLLLPTFLQRIVNGGGQVAREVAIGSSRVDLCVRWPLDPARRSAGPVQSAALELKAVRHHDGLDSTLANGLQQLSEYADRIGSAENYLIIFDQRPGKTWTERNWHRTEQHAGRAIGIWGM
jgi:hypothetical protein